MPIEFIPSAIEAVLKTDGDHWVVDVVSAATPDLPTPEPTLHPNLIPRDEVREEIGDEGIAVEASVVDFIETSLRRAGWVAERGDHLLSPPSIQSWVLSPASEFGGRANHHRLFS
jgi:hypothetical protein